MNSRELADLLDSLSQAYITGGLRKSAPPLATLVKDLRAFSDAGVDQVRRSIRNGELPRTAKRTSGNRSMPTDEAVIANYLERLRAADGDEQAFLGIVDTLKSDRKVRVAKELAEILKRYSGGALSGSNKATRLHQLKAAYTLRQTQIRNRKLAGEARPF